MRADTTATDVIRDVEQLETLLSEPPAYLVNVMRRVQGDVLLLGVAGKMGPTLARMAVRASEQAGASRRVIGVSRFSGWDEQRRLESWGVQTIKCDLLDERALGELPDAPNIIYLAGMKFGATGNESLTWAMNTHLPALVCRRFANSRIAAFSTGNVYGMCPLHHGGNVEGDPPNPTGEYAMSCLGRERMFEHFSRAAGVRVSLLRLNYACELRYGVLVDLAQKVWAGEAVDVTMPAFNAIWQGDANAMALGSLEHSAAPAFVVNIAGPEVLSVRRVCEQLGALMGREARFTGAEAGDAILSNGQLGHRLFGYPRVGVNQMIEWTAKWVMAGGAMLGKPTHFETRDGKF